MKLTSIKTIKTATPLATTIAAGAIALLALANTAHANIGETYQQSCKRYGKPNSRVADDIVWWINSDFSLQASFNGPHGRCDSIQYNNWATKSWDEANINTLIAFNMTAPWQEKPVVNGRFWFGGDRYAFLEALVAFDNGRSGMGLKVETDAAFQRWSAKHPVTSEQAPDANSLPDLAKPSPTPTLPPVQESSI